MNPTSAKIQNWTVILVVSVAAFLATTGKLAAANVTLKTHDAFGTSSITGATNWSDGLVATAGNNYFTSNKTLRTPAPTISGNTYIFGGDSLSVDPGARLIGKVGNGVAGTAVTATLTISNLILNGGLCDQADVNNNNSTLFLDGNVFVNTNSSIGAIGALTNNHAFFNTLDILAPISGAASLQVSGSSVVNGADTGVVKLSAANPYSGTMTVNSGTNAANGSVIASQINRMLQLNNVDALSNATLNVVAAASVQNLVSFASGANTGPFKLGALAGVTSQSLTDTAGAPVALVVGSKSTNTTYSGVLSGAGSSLTKIGNATLTLNGANTFTGNTTVSGGALALGAAGSLAGSPSIIVADGATLDVSASAFTVLGGQSYFCAGTNLGSVSVASSGRLFAGGDVSYGTNVTTSSLVFSNGAEACLDLGTLHNGANDLITVAGNLNLNNTAFHLKAPSTGVNLDASADYTLITVTGTITGSASSTPVWDTAPLNAGNYTIIQSGNSIKLHYLASTPPVGTLSFTPNSLAHNQSTLVSVTVTSSSHPISSVTLDLTPMGGSTLALISAGGNVYTNTIVIGPSVVPASYPLVATMVDNTSLSGTTPSATLTVISATTVWNGGGANNNWSANANWAGGAAPGFVGDSVVFAGTTRLTPNMDANYGIATLSFDGTAGSFVIGSAGNVLTLSGGGITNNSTVNQTLNLPIVNAGLQAFSAQAANLTFNQVVTNNGATLMVSGSANTAFNGSVAGTGGLSKDEGGTLTLNGTNTFTGPILISAGTLEVAGAGLLGGGNYAGNITNASSFVYSSTAAQTLSGVLSAQGVTKNGSGTLTLTGTNTYTGPTTINGGVLRIAGAGMLGSAGVYAGTIVNDGTLQHSSSANQRLSGTLSGTGGLVKDGTGTLINNAGSYSGPTAVRGGILALNTSILGASPFGDMTVSNGAVAVTSFGDASINVANLILHNNAQLNLNYDFSFGNPTVGAINAATSLSAPGTNITINVGGVAPAIGQFPLIAYTGSVLPNLSNFTLGASPLGTTATLVNNTANHTIDLNVTAVNPTSWIPLAANDLLGTSSLNSGQSWLGAAAPVSGNGYHTKTFQLRSPADGNAYTFGGDVLSIDAAPSRFILKGTGGQIITVSNLILNGGIFDYANNADNFTATFNGGITLQGGTLSYMGALGTGNPAVCETFIINANIGGSGSLQVGPEFTTGADTGNLIFAGTNNYSGPTTVSTGTLVVNGKNGNSVLTVRSGAALAGLGSLGGPVTVLAGGNLMPGVPAFGALTPTIGVLTVNNSVALSGTTTIRLDRNAAPSSDRLGALNVAVNPGAVLTVMNLGSTNFVAGDTFTLFSTPVTGTFTTLTLPQLPSPDLVWTNKTAFDGTIAVVSTQTVNPNPTNITFSASGGNLTLSWPQGHTGWTLQAQTNSLSSGLGTNWFNIPGSTATNQFSIPLNGANGSVFFRLKL